MNKYIYILFFLPLLLFACSTNDETIVPADIPAGEVAVYFSTNVPAMGKSKLRAVNEEEISSINVLIFEDTETGYEYNYQVAGYSINSIADAEYNFYARIPPSDNAIKLYLLANAPDATSVLTGGETEEQVKAALTDVFTAAGFDGTLPMFGEAEFIDGLTEDTDVQVALVRSVARADVVNMSTDNFTLASVEVYRASNRYQLIPNALTSDNVATIASIPTGTIQSVHTIPAIVNGNALWEQIYIPESPLPEASHRQLGATVIVVGGIYGTDTDTTYYRMDFVPDNNTNLFGQVLRNHRYQFNITDVYASGWRTPGEAADYPSSQLEVEIKAWEENTVDMVFDDVNYLGVTSRIINLAASIGSSGSISVDTNLDNYLIYWTDADGNIDNSIAPITWNESFNSPDDLFTVSVSNDGTQITAIANAANSTGEPRTRYLLVEANRLRIRLTITQGLPSVISRSLNVFGSTEEIGSLGDWTLGNNVTNKERTLAMTSIMRNSNNFGPSGTVPIEKINIAGRAGYILTEPLISLFDVVYLTYNSQYTIAQATPLLNWVDTNNKRVLIVQHDNGNTNANVISALGLSSTLRANTNPFTVYEYAPQEIMSGVFGTVPYTLQWRCYDTTHGEIDVDLALQQGYTPILIGGAGGMVLGINFERGVVLCGDIDIYSSLSSNTGEKLPNNTGIISNDPGILIGNLWSWIATRCLSE